MPARLRPATAADRPLLLAIYASTREAELAVLPWDDAAKRAFIDQQFTAQDAYYRSVFPDRSFDVVELEGVPVGRLYVARLPDETVIADIAVLPPYRNRGVGTALLTELARDADEHGRRLTLHVDAGSPARRLYERFGFVEVEPQGFTVLMARAPVS